MIYDYESIWALRLQPGFAANHYQEILRRYYDACFRAGVNVDIVPPSADFSKYRVILAPDLFILPDPVARRLSEFVARGGVLLTDCRSGVKDETNLCHARTLPGLLSDTLGIAIEEYENIMDGFSYKAAGQGGLPEALTATHFADWIIPCGAEVLASYEPWHMKTFAAVTRNRHGKGTGYYVGTLMQETAFYDALMADVFKTARIKPVVRPPAGVEAVVRQGKGRKVLFLINHTEEARTVAVPKGKRDLLTGKATGESLRLGTFGVAVIRL
jgi:beta-galactosidase